jgi:hypothetical protein
VEKGTSKKNAALAGGKKEEGYEKE